MFDVGFWELSLIFIIALMVLGPERLPRVARDVGLWIGRLRRYVGTVREDIEREVHAQELRELINKPRELDDLKEVISETKGALNQVKTELTAAERAASKDASSEAAVPAVADKPASPAAAVGMATSAMSSAAAKAAAEVAPAAEAPEAAAEAPASESTDADHGAKAG